jgi:hypothetical protein
MTMSDDDLIRRDDVLAAIGDAAYKHLGHDAYSNGMDAGARFQTERDLAAVRALPAVTPRPMKDAPRDGTKVLAWWPSPHSQESHYVTTWCAVDDAGREVWQSPFDSAPVDETGWHIPTRFLPHPPEGGSDA